MALKSFKEFLNEEEQLDEFLTSLGAGLAKVGTVAQTAIKTGITTRARSIGSAATKVALRNRNNPAVRSGIKAVQAFRNGNLSKGVLDSNAMLGSTNNDSNQEASGSQQQEPLARSGGDESNRVSAPPTVQTVSNNRPASLSTGGQTIRGSATGSLMAAQQNTMNSLYGQNNIGRFRR